MSNIGTCIVKLIKLKKIELSLRDKKNVKKRWSTEDYPS